MTKQTTLDLYQRTHISIDEAKAMGYKIDKDLRILNDKEVVKNEEGEVVLIDHGSAILYQNHFMEEIKGRLGGKYRPQDFHIWFNKNIL